MASRSIKTEALLDLRARSRPRAAAARSRTAPPGPPHIREVQNLVGRGPEAEDLDHRPQEEEAAPRFEVASPTKST